MTAIPASIRAEVRERAGMRFEYCRLPEDASSFQFHLEHIISLKHEGSSEIGNLAWACMHCNLANGTDIAAYDSETDTLVRLFNPRIETWADHFGLANAEIVGKTPTGRVTIRLLSFNSAKQVEQRSVSIRLGFW